MEFWEAWIVGFGAGVNFGLVMYKYLPELIKELSKKTKWQEYKKSLEGDKE